jgi:hypothetical protein
MFVAIEIVYVSYDEHKSMFSSYSTRIRGIDEDLCPETLLDDMESLCGWERMICNCAGGEACSGMRKRDAKPRKFERRHVT